MYKYNDNTLLHGAGVNFVIIDSILRNGIASEKYGKENNIKVNRNYIGYNLDDTISCIRYLYVNPDIDDSAYNKYIPNGISFIIENTPFIYDKSERLYHRYDEVLVKNFIPRENIKGINIPDSLIDKRLENLEYVREDSTSYINIKHIADEIKNYITNNSDMYVDYNDYYLRLYNLNNEYTSSEDKRKKEIKREFKEVIKDLNYLIGLDYEEFFSNILNKKEVTVYDIVKYLNDKTLKLPIYDIKTKIIEEGFNR